MSAMRKSLCLPSRNYVAPSPLYLYRAPTHQIRIGLCSDRLSPGDTVEGTVLVYRENATGEHSTEIINVSVALHCEVARRKFNLSYRSGQQFRPQDISPLQIFHYDYTHTLVPLSRKWLAGPYEALYHHVTTLFRPVIHAEMSSSSTRSSNNSGRLQTYPFSFVIPSDVIPSHVWNGIKDGSFVDVRYRVVAIARLSQPFAMLMAETVFLVNPSTRKSLQPATFERTLTRRSSIATSCVLRNSLTLTINRCTFPVGERDVMASVTTKTSEDKCVQVEVVESVAYDGKVSSERSVPCVPRENNTCQLSTRGLFPDTILGPLVVTHQVRAVADKLQATAQIRLTAGMSSCASVAQDGIRSATRLLRRQPPIYYYLGDELPLFRNLEYRAAGSANVRHRISAAVLATRLPRLTQAGSSLSDDDVCCLCLDGLADGMVTRLSPCAHVLHLVCARRWLRHATIERLPVVNCPICKKELQ